MLVAVLSGFVLAAAAPWLHRVLGGAAGWVFALLPLGLTIYFASFLDPVSLGETIRERTAWVPSLGVDLAFSLDGLSLLFALLICGIGLLIVIYAGGYLAGHPQQGRFFTFLLMFMASMLGVVLSDNLLVLFVFWELTSLSSYFLIGFDHGRDAARSAALQALLVTGIGGLSLLAGLLLLGQVGGSFEISTLLAHRQAIQTDPLFVPIVVLILLGAFTKSAQFPFHIWLPNAMEAPTPVSAYLHSSTMVKAGVYLLARLSPLLAGTGIWLYAVTGFGAATMLVGAYLAFRETYYKRILAYSTVSSLGTMVMLLGLGTELAVIAAMAFLLAHALYKGALFMVAGAVDHESGERDTERLGGLARAMPITALAAVLAAVSMAGIPPLFGFMGKEMVLEAVVETEFAALLLITVVMLASVLTVALAGLVGFKPFIGKRLPTPKHPHEAPPSLWLGPILLAGLGVLIGVWPVFAAERVLTPTVGAVLGQPETVKLVLWHGWNVVLALSIVAVAFGVATYFGRSPLRRGFAYLDGIARYGPAGCYQSCLNGLFVVANGQTRVLQNGYLRYYLATVFVTTIGLVGLTFVTRFLDFPAQGIDHVWGLLSGVLERSDWRNVRFYELGLAVVILLATAATVHSRGRLGAIAALGVVGFGVALIFVLFGAPDLAMTQFVIETLTVILFVLVFYHLPRFAQFSSRPARLRDMVLALTVGVMMAGLVMIANDVDSEPVSREHIARSYPEGHGRNIVNVILVDFRSLDTLGEITVLGVAGVGVYALLKLRLARRRAEP